MSVPPESIQVDRCYLTEGGSVRRVTSTGSDGWLQYRERDSTGHWLDKRWTRRLRRQVFAGAALRQVPCDWTPETDGAGN
jgi:hypothetical protein